MAFINRDYKEGPWEINRHIHLKRRERLRAKKLETPSPPFFLEANIFFHPIKANLLSKSTTPLKKFQQTYFNKLRTPVGHLKMDIWYNGKELKTNLIKVMRPPIESFKLPTG